MTELTLTYPQLDDSFHKEVRDLAKHFVGLLNGASEAPEWWFEQATDTIYETLLEHVLALTVRSVAVERLERVLEDRAESMAHNRFLRGAA